MKPFHFPLEKVLRWRRTQLEFEELKLKQLYASLRQLEHAREEVETKRAHAEKGLLKETAMEGWALEVHCAYRKRLQHQSLRLGHYWREQERRIEEQRPHLLEAQRRLRLLENLKERRLAQWTRDQDREIEDFASESFLARWSLRKRHSHQNQKTFSSSPPRVDEP